MENISWKKKPSKADSINIFNEANRIIKKAKSGVDFKSLANEYTDDPGNQNGTKGGDLGWVNENVLSENIKSILINTPVGSISEHIVLPQGILIFKIRDKRKVDRNLSLEQMKNQLVKYMII